jgi:hypothetical protein
MDAAKGERIVNCFNARVLASAMAVGIPGMATAAGVQWSGNGHFYNVISVPATISWDAANASATAAGGYLATVTSQAENEFVFSLVSNATYWHGSSGPWLGGYQSPASTQPDANWQWVTGEPWSYTNWQEGQPNDAGGKNEDKLQYGFAPLVSTWNDIMPIDPTASFRPIAYVVEVVPEPSSFLLGTGAICVLACARRRQRRAGARGPAPARPSALGRSWWACSGGDAAG